jgi:hypothetical protein
MRRQLPCDRDLEPGQAIVASVMAVLGEHRPQRLSLVHRDHQERAAGAGQSVEPAHGVTAGIEFDAAMRA